MIDFLGALGQFLKVNKTERAEFGKHVLSYRNDRNKFVVYTKLTARTFTEHETIEEAAAVLAGRLLKES